MDSGGNPIQLRGISTHGIAWFPDYINESCFGQLREEWNANVIRLAMYTGESGGYCTGGDRESLKQLIDKGVSYATAQDMYVIIDWHILSDGNPNEHLEEAKAFFGEMSTKYAGYSNVLYEICNEPNGSTTWSDIKAYAEAVIGVIRSHDEKAVILVGTPNWSQQVDQAAAQPIAGYGNIMYTLHFYAATHTDALRNVMVSALDSGLPVFVSEYGICDASGNGAINESQANQWVETMDRYGVSYVAWNLSNKAETSALLRSDCKKTSNFVQSDLSDSGKWLYHMLTGKGDFVPSKTASAPSQPGSSVSRGEDAMASSGTFPCTAKLQNSWESEGQTFFQYDVTIQNPSEASSSQWNVSIDFNEAITLTDSWNGMYAANGKTLSISSMDYNGNIPPGGSAQNIGFIVKGSPQLKIISLG